ncbi:MAG: polysaccharide pyruvyl transferase family protein, partial [Parabacteroides sp.]|nr:polysaccharide pyruvyl transferase family protein [Parabacteroides sp.]
QLRKQGTKTILWGCSVEPEAIQGKMLEDLKGYTHIFARESITYQAMKDKGIQQVSLFPDPAFQLNRIDLPLPTGFVEKNTVGINVSPLIMGCEQHQGITLKNYIALIQYLIEHTDMQITLIPHVVWNHNDDRIPLSQLYEQFKDTGRIILLEDHNAEELKGYIARCRFMVAARTHASIAAYSEQVPTLVVGYSVKAKGIAKDIFGTDEHYVIPVQALQQEDDLVKAFLWIYAHESDIKEHYQRVMPVYKAKALEVGNKLNEL